MRIGAWQVRGTLGHGGMSEVYDVVDDEGRRAALKVLGEDEARRPHAAQRFELEGRVLRELRHPGVPEIFEVGACADGRPYLVMELLVGMTLAEVLRQGAPARSFSLVILEQLVDVLATAHKSGVVHRDLKPDNIILVDADDLTVKLVDWGIAKRVDDHAARVNLTTTGNVVGTPRYLSPEQARSEPVDTRTDVYTLGLVAYELLLGTYPFDADNVGDTLVMQMTRPPPSPRRFWPEIPANLDRVLLAMLAKDPLHRPALSSVLEVIHDVIAGHDDTDAAAASGDAPGTGLAVTANEKTTARCRRLRRP